MNPRAHHSASSTSRPTALADPRDTESIEVVQYADFTCLDCGRAASTLQSFRMRFEKHIRFSYRYFFPRTIHPHALNAAEAAECARAQGRFWQMHDLLMANQDQLSLQYLYEYAEQSGLDMARFDVDMDGEVYLPTIQENIASGVAAGVIRTPSFLVDSILIECSRGLGRLYDATVIAIQL